MRELTAAAEATAAFPVVPADLFAVDAAQLCGRCGQLHMLLEHSTSRLLLLPIRVGEH